MIDYSKYIIGKWRNSEVEYIFNADGSLAIYWFKSNTTERGTWCSNGNQIEFKYTAISQQYHTGKIIYFTSSEISVTSTSHELNQATIMRKVSFDDAKLTVEVKDEVNPLLEESTKVEEKARSFKEKALDFLGLFVMFVFLGGGISFVCYAGYEEFLQESFESKSLILGLPLLGVAIVIIVHLLLEDPYKDNMFKYIFYILLAIFLGLPLFFVLLKMVFTILESWWLILCISMLIVMVMILKKEELKWTHKVGTILLIIVALYFLFYASGIFKIKFDVYFDNKKLENSEYNEEPRV